MAVHQVGADQPMRRRFPAAGAVAGRALISGLAIGAAVGVTAIAWAFAPTYGPLGAAFGLVIGLMMSLVPTAIGACVLAVVAPATDVAAYHRRIDRILGAFALAATLGALVWPARGAALVGTQGESLAALVVVLVGLAVTRGWLRALAEPRGRAF